ncbi:helix-turn-helix domain-containing protein [Enterobacter asburiae]
MKHTCTYRFYPAPAQVELLAQTFGCVRLVYSAPMGTTSARESKLRSRCARLIALPEFAGLNNVSSLPL